MLFSSLFLGALVVGGSAIPTGYVLHEKKESSNSRVARGNRVHGDAIVSIRIGLQQSNLEKGYDMLMDLSHPDSVNYGKHLTAQEVNKLFAPSHHSIRVVKDWLIVSGIPEEHIDFKEKGWLAMDIPASMAESLFDTRYYEHETDNGNLRLGCDEYSLPEHISEHVDFIKPGVTLSPPVKRTIFGRANDLSFTQRFGNPAKSGNGTQPKAYSEPAGNATSNAISVVIDASLSGCGSAITPPCIRPLYDIPKVTTSDSSNVLGIWETGNSYAQADLNTYFSKYATNIPSGTGPIIDKINGGSAPSSQSSAGLEADIDFEMAYPLVYPERLLVYEDSSPGAGEATETFLTGFLDYVDGSFCTSAEKNAGYQCGVYRITRVVSFSYAESELALSQAAQQRSCNEIMKLSMQGTTFVVASGDYGVALGANAKAGRNGCYNPNNSSSNNGTVFAPSFPNNCPYVLSVGATMIPEGKTVTDPEAAMLVQGDSDASQDIYFSSSGGFANYFPRPSYQDASVNTYFQSHDPGYAYYTYNDHDLPSGKSNIGADGGVYNRAGRGFPDVSANGVNFVSVNKGNTLYTAGTSLAAPLWASIITLINENRTAAGKATVGFVNPTLYANPQAFNDITSGSNPGCESKGFQAVSGWDPVTGLGTPKFPSLLSVFAALP